MQTETQTQAQAKAKGTRASAYPQTTMRVKKRNGSTEPVDVNKIVRAVSRCCVDLRDESAHMAFAFEVVSTVRREEPELFDEAMEREVAQMLDEAIECEVQFAEDLLAGGVAGLSVEGMRQYLEFCADQRLSTLGLAKRYHAKNPFTFMDLQDVQEVTNFFERRVSAYQVGVTGEVVLDASF